MSDPAFYLDDETNSDLREMRRDWKSRRNSFGQSYHRHSDDSDQTPDIYLARTPSGGIPALDENGTGTTYDDVFGSAVCTIYRLSLSGSGTGTADDDNLVEGVDRTQRVFNSTTSDVAGSSWILVIRDKFGVWWVAKADGESAPVLTWLKPYGSINSSPYKHYYATISTFNSATGAWTEDAGVAGGAGAFITAHHGGDDFSLNTHYLAKLNGTLNNGTFTRPLYVTIADADVVGGTAYAGLIGKNAQAIDGVKNFRDGIKIEPTGAIGNVVETYNSITIYGPTATKAVMTVSGDVESTIYCSNGVVGSAGVSYVVLYANPAGGGTSEIHLGNDGTIYMRDLATGGRIQYHSGGQVSFPDGIYPATTLTPNTIDGGDSAGVDEDVVISGTTYKFRNGLYIGH